jgi:hypothetical protein
VHNKQTVRRLVEEAVNGGRDELIDARFTRDMTAWVRDWFGAVSPLLPDIHMELVPAGGGS